MTKVVTLMDTAIHFSYSLLLLLSLGALMSQICVKNKQLIHILFAVFCGSITMMATKKLTGDAVGYYQYALGMGTCATCNVFWLVARALFRGDSGIGRQHILAATVVGLAIMGSQSLKFVSGAFELPPTAFATSLRLLSEVLAFLSPSLLLLALWEGCRNYSKLERTEKLQRIIFLTSFGLALLVCCILVKVVPSPDTAPKLQSLTSALAAIGIILVTQALIIWRFHLKRKTLSGKQTTEETPGKEKAVKDEDLDLLTAINTTMAEQLLYLKANLKVSDLARQFNVPEYRISRALRLHQAGKNFNQYVNLLRCEHAKILLENPAQKHLPVLTIGLESGFSSPGPFTRAFKQNYGCTPNEFRQNLVEANIQSSEAQI